MLDRLPRQPARSSARRRNWRCKREGPGTEGRMELEEGKAEGCAVGGGGRHRAGPGNAFNHHVRLLPLCIQG